MIRSLEKLCRELGYTFISPELLEASLTHRSANKRNNERLEFLGDGILNFVIAEELYRRFPHATEGELSRLRASLVKGDKLAELSSKLEIGEYLTLGPGELKSGGFRRSSILADALEALFGAIYLDSGFDSAKQIILSIYQTSLDSITSIENIKDPKTMLQEFLQSRKRELPLYDVIGVSGEAHKQTFRVCCKISGLNEDVIGTGSSRRKAEQDAAQKCLELLANE